MLREVHRLRAFENRVLRKIFGPKVEEVTGECGSLCYEEFHDFYPRTILFGRSKQEE
jgi:hypothetical protein